MQSYINEFMFFVFRRDETGNTAEHVLCMGINVDKFLPLTKGRHGLASNPAYRGLQITRQGLRELALKRGIRLAALRGFNCSSLIPTKDFWYSEQFLIEMPKEGTIDDLEGFFDELLRYAVEAVVRSILQACRIDEKIPKDLMSTLSLQQFLEELCLRHKM